MKTYTLQSLDENQLSILNNFCQKHHIYSGIIDKKFNNDGLRHSPEYLEHVGMKIILLPLELMANYADKTTIDTIDSGNNMELAMHFLKATQDMSYMHICTKIGNMAYTALYAKDARLRSLTSGMLSETLMCYYLSTVPTMKN